MWVSITAIRSAAIYPTEVIESGAIVGKGTTVSPYCIIGGNGVIGDDCSLTGHVHVRGHTTVGARTRPESAFRPRPERPKNSARPR